MKLINARLPPDLRKEINDFHKKNGFISFSETVRQLLITGLKYAKKEK